MTTTCEICGKPAQFIAAFPSGEVTTGAPVYDGGSVCSAECAKELRRRHQEQTAASVRAEYEQTMRRLGARFEDALDPSGERDPEAEE